jgi:hypothetical protein
MRRFPSPQTPLPRFAGVGFLPEPSPQTPLPERERGFGQHQGAEFAAAPPAPREGEGGWGDEGTSALGRDPGKTLHLRGEGPGVRAFGALHGQKTAKHSNVLSARKRRSAGRHGLGGDRRGVDRSRVRQGCRRQAARGKFRACGRSRAPKIVTLPETLPKGIWVADRGYAAISHPPLVRLTLYWHRPAATRRAIRCRRLCAKAR